MKLRASFLARAAGANDDGSFDITGGGVTDFIAVPGYVLGAAFRLHFSVFLRVELEDSEIETLGSVELTIMFEGQRLGWPHTLPIAMRRIEGQKRYYFNVITNMTLDVPKTGEGYIQVVFNPGRVSAPHLHFQVKA